MAGEIEDQGMDTMAESSPLDSFSDGLTPASDFEGENPESIQIQVSPELEKVLVDIVMEDYEASKKARDHAEWGLTSKGDNLDFDDWMDGLRDLYNGKRESKPIPWEFCSNRSLRIAAAIVDMLHARLYASIVNNDLLRWRPGEVTDVPKVERIDKLMYWWIWVRSKMRPFFDNWVKAVIAYGDAITESSWKVTHIDKGKTIEEPVVGPDGNTLINPDGKPAINKYRDYDMFEQTVSRVYLRDKFFLQEGSQNIYEEPVILEDDLLFRQLQEGEEKDAFKNVSTELREKIPFDKAQLRAGLEQEEQEKIRDLKIRNHSVKILKWYGNYDADGDGFAEDIRIIISPDYRVYLGGVACKNLTETGKRPLDFTKIDSKIECLFTNRGEGVLEKIKELAEEIDAIFNQMTDANTLSILRPGFYDPHGDLNPPVLKIAPNKMQPVVDPQRSVYYPDVQIPTERLIAAIQLVIQFIERLTAASSYVLGKESEIVGGSGTATRTNAIMQSAEQRFALPAERLREGAANIITQHLDILQLNIPKGLEDRILGKDNKPVFEVGELTKQGIACQMDAYLLPDPTLGSKSQERELANMLYGVLMQNPLVGTDPSKIYKVTADLIRANDKDPKEYLGPEPDQDDIDSPEEENTLLLQGDFGRVRAQIAENHIQHIKVHQDLLQDPYLLTLPENLAQEVIRAAQSHIQEHMMMMQTMMGMIQKFGQGKGAITQNAGGAEQRPENGNPSGSQGTQGSPGMEQIPGALGQALNSKRQGEMLPH